MAGRDMRNGPGGDFIEFARQEAEQIWLLDVLQRLAYFDADTGGAQDIAQWCVSRWLQIIQRDPNQVGALRGLGQAWLLRSQPCLARIHHNEASSSSSGGSSAALIGAPGRPYTSVDEARDTARAIQEADARLHTADYVEARGMLLPATEYFSRAVENAESQNVLTGNLLALAAEAFMSLGNVSYSNVNEEYFRRALSYLDDYGRLVDE
ncbi:hypothetical protein UCRPC4_g06345 [Phaeomoniella chlamydospora]|uniref:Uncharacterized protein n=1 Tax=Phaeomoniella chlamydospora TaxID=158046 RepID=A0A0G2FUC0_PHACM|nr:hypothetical protein UCRPC4_g06345 [Phaeomoniella chlamydospora]